MLNYFLPFKVDPINKHCFAQVSRNLAITKNKVNPEEEGGEEVRGAEPVLGAVPLVNTQAGRDSQPSLLDWPCPRPHTPRPQDVKAGKGGLPPPSKCLLPWPASKPKGPCLGRHGHASTHAESENCIPIFCPATPLGSDTEPAVAPSRASAGGPGGRTRKPSPAARCTAHGSSTFPAGPCILPPHNVAAPAAPGTSPECGWL